MSAPPSTHISSLKPKHYHTVTDQTGSLLLNLLLHLQAVLYSGKAPEWNKQLLICNYRIVQSALMIPLG